MTRFTVATIAAGTVVARASGLGALWLAEGPMPGETVDEVLYRTALKQALWWLLSDAGLVERSSPEQASAG